MALALVGSLSPGAEGTSDPGCRTGAPKVGVGQARTGSPFRQRSGSTPGQAIASVPGAVAWTPPLLLHGRTPLPRGREALAPLTPQGWIL